MTDHGMWRNHPRGKLFQSLSARALCVQRPRDSNSPRITLRREHPPTRSSIVYFHTETRSYARDLPCARIAQRYVSPKSKHLMMVRFPFFAHRYSPQPPSPPPLSQRHCSPPRFSSPPLQKLTLRSSLLHSRHHPPGGRRRHDAHQHRRVQT